MGLRLFLPRPVQTEAQAGPASSFPPPVPGHEVSYQVGSIHWVGARGQGWVEEGQNENCPQVPQRLPALRPRIPTGSLTPQGRQCGLGLESGPGVSLGSEAGWADPVIRGRCLPGAMGHSRLRPVISIRDLSGWRPTIRVRDQPEVQGQARPRVRDKSQEERPPRGLLLLVHPPLAPTLGLPALAETPQKSPERE